MGPIFGGWITHPGGEYWVKYRDESGIIRKNIGLNQVEMIYRPSLIYRLCINTANGPNRPNRSINSSIFGW